MPESVRMPSTNAAAEARQQASDRVTGLFAGARTFLSRATHDGRDEALAEFLRLGFPTRRIEEWRFTPLGPLFELDPVFVSEPDPERARAILETVPEIDAHRFVFHNGWFVPELSASFGSVGGCTVGSLALTPHARLGSLIPAKDKPFAAINAALWTDGPVLVIPRATKAVRPFHFVFLSDSAAGTPAVNTRIVVVAGEGSAATVVETHAGREGDVYFSNSVAEIEAGESSSLDYYKLQRESRSAVHIAAVEAAQARSSSFSHTCLTFGASLSRNDIGAGLLCDGASVTLNGLYMVAGSQVTDHHTSVRHAAPNCETREVYKGILDESAAGVFNGRILVEQDAQHTDARQTNKNLLLSAQAKVNSNPQLEIFADDVKCTHGATVGQIDEEHLFYLRTRGIGLEDARNVLTYAFANDIVRRIRVKQLRAAVETAVLEARDIPSEFAFFEVPE